MGWSHVEPPCIKLCLFPPLQSLPWEQNHVVVSMKVKPIAVLFHGLAFQSPLTLLFVENKNEKCIIFPSLEGWLTHSNCVPISLQIAVHLEVHSDMKFCRTL